MKILFDIQNTYERSFSKFGYMNSHKTLSSNIIAENWYNYLVFLYKKTIVFYLIHKIDESIQLLIS